MHPAHWGRGCSQSLRQEHFLLTPKLKLFQKTSYLATLLYWWTYARRMSILFAIPFAVVLGLSVWALILLIVTSINARTLHNSIILYWIVINIKNLLFALFFMHGRANHHAAEPFYVKIPAVICSAEGEFEGMTSYVSETNLEVLLDKSIDIPPDKPLRVVVRSNGYKAELFCVLSNAAQTDQNWKYRFLVDPMDSENKRQYMQIVYDRTHTLSQKLAPSSSVFDDLNVSLVNHTRRKAQRGIQAPT